MATDLLLIAAIAMARGLLDYVGSSHSRSGEGVTVWCAVCCGLIAIGTML
jgi:hypothetical protein